MRKAILMLTAVLALSACQKKQEVRNVPDVVSPPTYVTEAVKKLQAHGFRAELVAAQDAKRPPGGVLDYAPRTPQPAGALIKLTVSTKDKDPIPFNAEDGVKLSEERAKALREFYDRQNTWYVPDAKDKPLVEAIRLVQAQGFHVAIAPKFDRKARPGMVVDQLPPPETELRWRSTVTLYTTVTRRYEPKLSDADAEKLSQATADELQTTFQSMPPARKGKT